MLGMKKLEKRELTHSLYVGESLYLTTVDESDGWREAPSY